MQSAPNGRSTFQVVVILICGFTLCLFSSVLFFRLLFDVTLPKWFGEIFGLGYNLVMWGGLTLVVVAFISGLFRRGEPARKQPKVNTDVKYLVNDGDQIQGVFSLREICERLDDGTFSRMATVFKDGDWKQPHEVGVVYKFPNSSPAPSWGG